MKRDAMKQPVITISLLFLLPTNIASMQKSHYKLSFSYIPVQNYMTVNNPLVELATLIKKVSLAELAQNSCELPLSEYRGKRGHRSSSK